MATIGTDLPVRMYEVSLNSEDAERRRLRSEGWEISETIVVSGFHLGFVAVKWRSDNTVGEALVVSAIPTD